MKLVGIMLVSLIPVAGYDVVFDRLTLPLLGDFDLGWLAYPLTVLWIATLANLINLIDGMDSLAAGIVSIAAFSFAVLAVSYFREPEAIFAACICGATLAFLFHNYHPAKIFMGDSGGARARLRPRGGLGAGRLEDRRDDRPGRAAARAGRADPRHVVRGAQAAPSTAGHRGPPTRTTSTTGSCASGCLSGGRRRTCTPGRSCWRPTRSCSASCRPGRTATGSSTTR